VEAIIMPLAHESILAFYRHGGSSYSTKPSPDRPGTLPADAVPEGKLSLDGTLAQRRPVSLPSADDHSDAKMIAEYQRFIVRAVEA